MRDSSATYFAEPGRQTQEQLAAQMRRSLDDPCIKAVLDAVTGFVVILNENRQILAGNQALLDALDPHAKGCVVGLRPGEAFNCIHFTEGTDGCGTSPHCRGCGAVLTILAAQVAGHPIDGECRLSMMHDGRLEALDLKVRATPLEVGGYRLVAFVLYDVSALKRREILEQTFLHDVLNAIGGISGWSDLLNQVDDSPAAREIAVLAESLKEEVITQRTLLAAERGELVINRQEFDAAQLIARLESLFSHHPIAKDRRLAIRPLPARTTLYTDQVLLLRVLVNMLKNAFEATPRGGAVQLWLEWRGAIPAFVVGNEGVIPDDVQLHLFERSFSTRATAGRGIGTYSMKLYGERYLGGAVSFVSDHENGTRFTFCLPPQQQSVDLPEDAEDSPAADPAARTVLLVDDNEALLRLGALLLTTLGYGASVCRGGAEALDVFGSAPDSFDAVITDWSMPSMNGAELARRLLEIRPGVPILICTGMGELLPVDRDQLGIRGLISKPFTLQELSRTLEAAMSAPVSRANPA